MALTTPTGQPESLQPGEFVSASHPSEVTFKLKELAPPSSMYVRPEDNLQCQFASTSTLGTPWRITYRLLLTNGTVQLSVSEFVPTVDGLTHQFNIPLTEGYLLSLTAQALGVTHQPFPGQTWVQVNLVRSNAAGAASQVVLCQGYAGSLFTVSWPDARLMVPGEGPGFITSVQQANPAAGADWTYTVPVSRRQRIQSLSSTLVTSAAAANRDVQLIVDDGVNVVWQMSAPAAVVAATTQVFSATGTNLPTGIITTTTTLVLPPGLVLQNGHRIRTATTGIQAGDQWSNIFLMIEDWVIG